MAKNRRNTNPLDKIEDKYGIAKTDKEIDRQIRKNDNLVAELVPRSPFLPNERGWHLWLTWAKLEAYGKEHGDAPVVGQIETKITSSKTFNVEHGPFKICRYIKMPRRRKDTNID